jgi:protein SCO1/2
MKRLLLAAALAALVGCSRPQRLAVYGEIPNFVLTSQTGEQFDSKSLAGKIWVADFMFTRCMGPCPRMSSQMHWAQKQTAGLPDVKFVSFTIDPEHDTPPVLTEYARRFHADPERWFFLTGPVPALQNLNRNAFKLGDVDGSMMHSTRFVLVDRGGRIRGYYHTEEGESLDPLVADIRRLAKEQS